LSQQRSGPYGLFSPAEDEVKLSDNVILSDTRFMYTTAHVKHSFHVDVFLAYPKSTRTNLSSTFHAPYPFWLVALARGNGSSEHER
jgi:hypothetical protein